MSDAVLRCFDMMRSCGLKSVPEDADAAQWHRVLSDVSDDLMMIATEHYIRTPVEGKGGALRGQRWCPTAGELRAVCFELETQARSEVTRTRRGCSACGERLGDDGSIANHGTGFRTITQHCHPVDDEGMVLWSSAPYRIASRSVLCDCDAGAWVAHKQAAADAGTVAPHLGGTWQPILTWQQALERYQRADARLYITGTEHRLVCDDRRPGSPWHSKPSPEEEEGNTEQASSDRQLAYSVIRGTVSGMSRLPPEARAHFNQGAP